MTKPLKPEPDDKEQSKRFIDTAKELGADESEESFERAFGIVAPKNLGEAETISIPKK